MADFALSDVQILAVSICKGPANRKRFLLKKVDQDPDPVPAPAKLLKSDDWTTVYACVAAPDWEEKSGSGQGADPLKTDVWASPDEIRKAAHSFMHSGSIINRMHENLEPYGKLVENFITPVDMTIGDELVKAGSWVIGIQPTEEGKRLIDSGEWDGVSYEGTGIRTPLQKDRDTGGTHRSCKGCGAKMPRTASKCQSCGASYVAKRMGPGGDIARNQGVQNGPLKNLIKFYLKKPHPFTSCVRDNRKRFGSRAENVCAALKDIGLQTTKWRKGNKSNLKKSDEVPEQLLNQVAASWEEAGLTDADASLALEGLMESEDRSLLHKIAVSMGLAKCEADCDCGCTPDEEDDVALTDEQTAALAKVDGLDEKVTELTKDDGRLAALEAKMETLLERIPEPEKKEPSAEEQREELSKAMTDMAASLQKAQEDLAKLAEGGTAQNKDADTLKKSDDPDAALAAAIF